MTAPAALQNTHPALRHGWHPVARSAAIGTDPVRTRLLGEDWVLVRLPTGLAAFVDRCPHRFAPLSLGWVDGDTLRCGFHGWCFDQAGACTEIPSMGASEKRPSRADVGTPWGLEERYGLVFLAPEEPVAPLLDFPEAEDPSFITGELDVIEANIGAGLAADNFLDMSHFPFLHAKTIGAEESAVVEEMDLQRDGFCLTVRSRHPFPNREDPAVATGERPLLQHRTVTYRYHAPFLFSLRIDYEEAGGTNTIAYFLQPVDDETVLTYCSIHRDDLDGDVARMEEAVSFESKILDEDYRFQQAYVDKGLPLDLTAEVHVKADRSTLELRRMLLDLVKENS